MTTISSNITRLTFANALRTGSLSAAGDLIARVLTRTVLQNKSWVAFANAVQAFSVVTALVLTVFCAKIKQTAVISAPAIFTYAKIITSTLSVFPTSDRTSR